MDLELEDFRRGIAKSQCERYSKKSGTALRAVEAKAAY
jgi:hypothetical protein